jgi:hypothetical protein
METALHVVARRLKEPPNGGILKTGVALVAVDSFWSKV